MATTESISYIEGVAPASVAFSFTHQAGTQRVAASVDMMQQTAAVHVQLAGAFPVGSKLGPQKVITGRGPLNKTTNQFVRHVRKCVIEVRESCI